MVITQEKNAFKPFVVTVIVLLGLAFSNIVLAQNTNTPGGGNTNTPPPPGNQTFGNPLGDRVDYLDVVATIVQSVLGIVGVLALLMFIYGGIVWMTSLGNSERVKLGRDTLVWAALGLVVVFASFAIVNLILNAFKAA